MSETRRSVTIRGKAAAKLAELAELSGRTEEWFANFMIVEYAERELEIVRSLKAAIKSADEGNVVPHEEVMAEIDAMIEAKMRRSA